MESNALNMREEHDAENMTDFPKIETSYAHGLFHSAQFEKFLVSMMLAWLIAAAIWVYIERRYLGASESFISPQVIAFVKAYLMYFVIVFGALKLIAFFGRRVQFSFNNNGFSFIGYFSKTGAEWREVTSVTETARGLVLRTGRKKINLSMWMAPIENDFGDGENAEPLTASLLLARAGLDRENDDRPGSDYAGGGDESLGDSDNRS